LSLFPFAFSFTRMRIPIKQQKHAHTQTAQVVFFLEFRQRESTIPMGLALSYSGGPP
jgi:hypothetical protein